MNDLFLQFIYALFATCGFAIIFHVPPKMLPICTLIGALAWSFMFCSILPGRFSKRHLFPPLQRSGDHLHHPGDDLSGAGV